MSVASAQKTSAWAISSAQRRATASLLSMMRTRRPWPQSVRAIVRPVAPPPTTTTSLTSSTSRRARRSAHSRLAAGEAIRTMRSPSSTTSPPPGIRTRSARISEAITLSSGTRISAMRRPTMFSAASACTSNSTISARPSANMSVCRAPGMPIARDTACAISFSAEIITSTGSSPARHADRYSALEVRTRIRPRQSARACRAATMLISSRSVAAITRSCWAMFALCIATREVPLPATVRTS